jgi:phosphoserine aminotransferase
MTNKPTAKPTNPCFSSGPCAKRQGWSVEALKDTPIGRSHRSKIGKAKLQEVIDRSRTVLGIPADYRIGVVAGSDTGAYELAMWTMLGARGIEMLAWESFSEGWVTDVVKQLKLKDTVVRTAPYGEIPDLSITDFSKDVCFTWNGTTSGACVPNADWIPANREGLTLCDATSSVFAMDMDFSKLDVVTWSWQKVMGGEAAHGMLMLSPRAVERLESYTPAWPLPKLFRLTKSGKLVEGIFKGETINTPSMLCVEDAIDGLKWAESIGGLKALQSRSRANLEAVETWVAKTPWVEFLAANKAERSCTSICLKIVDSWFAAMDDEAQRAVTKQIASTLEKEGVAYDIDGYRDAPAGLRLWGGATVELSDMQAVLPWLDYAYAEVKAASAQSKVA